MTKISARITGRYEVKKAYSAGPNELQPGCIVVECDCGEELTLTSASPTPTGWCGADHSAFIQDLQEREAKQRDEVTRPWHHDTQEQREQHLRDEAAYPKGSPWRYNDIRSGEYER